LKMRTGAEDEEGDIEVSPATAPESRLLVQELFKPDAVRDVLVGPHPSQGKSSAVGSGAPPGPEKARRRRALCAEPSGKPGRSFAPLSHLT
jgi:hypothetical protein